MYISVMILLQCKNIGRHEEDMLVWWVLSYGVSERRMKNVAINTVVSLLNHFINKNSQFFLSLS